MPLTTDETTRIVAAAQQHAADNGWLITVAIVDEGGLLQALSRMDGAPPLSAQIAEANLCDGTVTASIGVPVSSISIARLRPIDLATPTAGVEQNTAMFTPGSAKRAVSAATARSHIETSWQPAAVAMPCTRAITGWGIRVTVVIRSLHSANNAFCQAASSVCARISARSCPAQNPRPSAARTTTRAVTSSASASSSACSAAIMSRDSGL